MKTRALFLLPIWIVALACSGLQAAPIQITSSTWNSGKLPRLTLELTERPQVRIASKNPERLLIELDGTAHPGRLSQPPAAHPVGARIAAGPGAKPGSIRLQIDLKQFAKPQVRFEGRPNVARMIVEWRDAAAASKGATGSHADGAAGSQKGSPAIASKTRPRPVVIAIDAGHGGKDTGAIGPNGTREKDVVLAIAHQLAGYIRAEPGMKAVLVRRGDQFVDLRQRASVARRSNADLFVSLHADAYVNDQARGSSVFVLSERGASSEAARWLADSENAALVGGIKLKDKSRGLASVLLQLSTNATLEASERAAGKVLRELRKDFDIHHDAVQRAGFVVLKSPDIPSLLVETAFISNPEEERKLRTPRQQAQIARAVFHGIKAFFAGQASTVTVADAGESVASSKRSAAASPQR